MAHWDKFAEILPPGTSTSVEIAKPGALFSRALSTNGRSPPTYRQCAESLRYVVFDEAVREMALRPYFARTGDQREGDEAELKAAQLAARRRFNSATDERRDRRLSSCRTTGRTTMRRTAGPLSWLSVTGSSADLAMPRFGSIGSASTRVSNDIALKTFFGDLMSCKATLCFSRRSIPGRKRPLSF